MSKPDLHRQIGAALGLPRRIVSEYGMSELGSQAYDACVPVLPSARGVVDQSAHGTTGLAAAPGIETGARDRGEEDRRRLLRRAFGQ